MKRLERLSAMVKASAGAPRSTWFVPALTVVFVFWSVIPMAVDPVDPITIRAKFAQSIVDQLRESFAIRSEVRIALVDSHPLVFSVEPIDARRQRFRLSMEVGFLEILDDDELVGALAHELGHVWIYQHHPFLQTERLANEVAQRVVPRRDFEKVYQKLWAYEGTGGVPMGELLGPPAADASRLVRD